MAGHALDGCDVCLIGILAEGKLVGLGLGSIVQVRSGAVRVDVEDIVFAVAGLFEGKPHRMALGGSVRTGCGGVVGIAGVAIADHLSVDLGTARLGMLEALENQHGTAVSHHESAAVQVEGQGCVLGILGTGKGLGVGESGDSEGNGGIFASTADDGIRISELDRAIGLSQIMGRGGASGYDIDAGALGVVLDGNVPCRDVGNHRRDEHRGDPLPGRILYHLLGFAVLDFETAYAGAHIHAEAEWVDVGIFAFAAEACILHCLPGSGHTVLGEHSLLACEGLVHSESEGVEILYLTCYMDGKI